MCGIFGLACLRPDRLPQGFLAAATAELFTFSEARGREAAGIAVRGTESIDVLKQAGSASSFLKNPSYLKLVGERLEQSGTAPIALLGHSRLVTNGFQSNDDNNQPVVVTGLVGVHNGIVTNEAELWSRHPELTRETQVDTEVLFKLLHANIGETGDLTAGLVRTFEEMRGSASIATLFSDRPLLLLATNTGSLFTLRTADGDVVAFASERYILQRLLAGPSFQRLGRETEVAQVPPYGAFVLELDTFEVETLNLRSTSEGAEQRSFEQDSVILPVRDRTRRSADLRRCTKCILTSTYPLIQFDAEGVCDYCRRWRSVSVLGAEALRAKVEPYRRSDGKPDCIVAFSGGRDSTFGLHYFKTVLGMNPIAFTYDWGMVTDLARRNQARICGKLGIEHIVRSADIAKKRRYIRKNVEAWLHRPELGMVTLFTAGDKEFYHHARELRKETGVDLVIFCTGNMIEDTPYKTGFCGIRERDHGMTLTGLWPGDKIRLLLYYMKHYALNPRYFNESLWDTLKAYWHTFVVKDDFLYLFHYLPWSEEEIVSTIRREYDWEDAPDTKTTWRIGDGTAAFYNYIYAIMAGWTEDEVMLSNMIREGLIDRDEALRRAEEYGKPRYPSIQEYAQMIGINFEETLSAIHAAPRLY